MTACPSNSSPLSDIEADLIEAQTALHSPMGKLAAVLQGLPTDRPYQRAFLVGANPFVLQFDCRRTIAELVRRYFPTCRTIGRFARVTDITRKTDEQLAALREYRTHLPHL